MSDPDSWWARIKYIENFEDYVPVCQLYECDENMAKTKPFQPQHLNDFEPDKYYIVQTDKFNKLQSKKHDFYYALVGYLLESKGSVIDNIQSKECQWPSILESSFKPKKCCDKCQDIEENGSKNITKKCKTSRMCCWFDPNKLYPLLSLITELKTDSETTKVSINKLFTEVMKTYRNIKKRLYTNLCIYVPRLDDPDLSHLRLSFMDFFCLIEKWSDKLNLKCNFTSEKLEELFSQIENLQTGATSLPVTILVLVRLMKTRLISLKLGLFQFFQFLLRLMDKVRNIEEQSVILTRDIENIGIESEMTVTVYLHYATAILESLKELQELIIKDSDYVIVSSS